MPIDWALLEKYPPANEWARKYGHSEHKYVYALRVHNVLKIGVSDNPVKRCRDMCNPNIRRKRWLKFPALHRVPAAAYNSAELAEAFRFRGDVAHAVERWFHRRLDKHRIVGEWFSCSVVAFRTLEPGARRFEEHAIERLNAPGPFLGFDDIH